MQGKIVQQMGIDAQILVDLLRKVGVGEEITYETMTEAVGRDVQKDRGSLFTARNRLMRDEGICFCAVQNVGLRRLGDNEKVKVAGTYIDKIRRTSKRGMMLLASASYEGLDREGRQRHNLLASHLGTLAAISTSTAQKKLEGKMSDAKLPVALALEAFK